MILNNAPANQAVVSNVGEIGEFRIKNSAKAFNILSSGLYANKIRAIIRELSCNAVDSHTAAGRAGTPFDVHLPNQLEPYFSIRDYGVGLSHEEVVNIYTTYFESTKTSSNEFIGALGLGSKSPFSYTDNFTVTATKNGRRGIYTAFINEQGIPSIALMLEEASEDPSGVEVKFAVTDRWDFDKFKTEARSIYKYFNLRPVIHGAANFAFEDRAYESTDIVPGIHQYKNSRPSVAVMGNIAYNIAIPDSDTSLGSLKSLLSCGLEIHFDIGELDFQASREGLSYIPQTVEAIKNKLTALNAVLVDSLKQEADAIINLWERATFLQTKSSNSLWSAAAVAYLTSNPIPTLTIRNGNIYPVVFSLPIEDLASKFNIQLKGLQLVRGIKTLAGIKLHVGQSLRKPDGTYDTWNEHHVSVNPHDHFIINDVKRGAIERTKHHYKDQTNTVHSRNLWIVLPADKSKAMNIKAFFNAIQNPPMSQRFMASALTAKTRTSSTGKTNIMKLESRQRNRRSAETYVWANHSVLEDMDDTKTYYYVELDGWNAVGVPCANVKDYFQTLLRSGLFSENVYGVRKNDIGSVLKKTNWVSLVQHVANILGSMNKDSVMSLVKESIDINVICKYNSVKLNRNSPYAQLYDEFKDVQNGSRHTRHYVEILLRQHNIVNSVDPKALIDSYKTKVDAIKQRYPLLSALNYNARTEDVVEYINMIDQLKGIQNA